MICEPDACSVDNGGCDMRVSCTNDPGKEGGRTCGPCPPGSKENAVTKACEDIDVCSETPCFDGVSCATVPSDPLGFACGPCPPGYTGDGVLCSDVDECADGNNGGCDVRTTCINLNGTKACGACPAGFRGSGDVGCTQAPPTCSTNNGGCDPLTTCKDTDDGPVCGPCPTGYEGSGAVRCVDIDGCAASPCFPGAVCKDVPAPGLGHECGSCPEGYHGNADVAAGGSCHTCSTFASISATSLDADGMLARTSALTVVARAGMLDPPTCTNNLGFEFSWFARYVNTSSGTTHEWTLDETNKANTKSLFVPESTLIAGARYFFILDARMRGASFVKAQTSLEVTVTRLDPVATIVGGGVETGQGTSFDLDASTSYDPDASAGVSQLKFGWLCQQMGAASGATLCRNATNHPLELATVSSSVLKGLRMLGGPKGIPLRYNFTVAVNAGSRASFASTVVAVEQDDPPAVAVAPPIESGVQARDGRYRIDASVPLRLRAVFEKGDSTIPPFVSVQWSLFSCAEDGSSPCEPIPLKPQEGALLLSTSIFDPYLTLNASMLNDSNKIAYAARIIATRKTDFLSGIAWLNFTINAGPTTGPTLIRLPPGPVILLETEISVACVGFEDDDTPLSYLMTVTDASGLEVIARDFSPDPNVTTVMPLVGDVNVRCYARDNLGGISEPSLAFVEVVRPPVVSKVVVDRATQSADHALKNGDLDDAIVIIRGAAKLLDESSEEIEFAPAATVTRRNARSGTDDMSARDDLARTLARAQPQVVPTPVSSARILATANAVAAGGIGDQAWLTCSGAQDISSVVNGALADRIHQEMSPLTMKDAAGALSSVALSKMVEDDAAVATSEARTPDNSTKTTDLCPDMRTVVGLSDKLAKTMLIGASPNERPVNVSSPRVNVQATRSLKAPDMPAEAEAGGSKVFIPSSLLSVGSSNTSTVPRPEVDLILHVFQFPSTPNPIEPLPKGSAPNGTKIVPRQRLANSSAFVTFNITGRAGNIINPTAVGRRLGVHDLVSDPMMISLVLDEMGIEAMRNESRVAACTIWNSTSMQYADNACIALPNPRPTGIHARFRRSFVEGRTNATIASAWELFDADPERRALADNSSLWPTVLAAKCTSNVTKDGNVIWEGESCDLISAKLGCVWDNEKQAFFGKTCEYHPMAECGCKVMTGKDAAIAVEVAAALDVPRVRYKRKIGVMRVGALNMSTSDLKDIQVVVTCVCGLFGATMIIAIAFQYLDRSKCKNMLLVVLTGGRAEAAGFHAFPGDVWTWSLDPAGESLDDDKPSFGWGEGISEMINLSLMRIRLAIPLHALKERRHHAAEWAKFHREPSSNTSVSRPEGPPLGVERALGTCIVLGRLAQTGVLPPERFFELARELTKLPWDPLPRGASFVDVLSWTMALCAKRGPLSADSAWLPKLESACLLFLQNPDGSFDFTPELASILKAAKKDDDNAKLSNALATFFVTAERALTQIKESKQKSSGLWTKAAQNVEENHSGDTKPSDRFVAIMKGKNSNKSTKNVIVASNAKEMWKLGAMKAAAEQKLDAAIAMVHAYGETAPEAVEEKKPDSISMRFWCSSLAHAWMERHASSTFFINPWVWDVDRIVTIETLCEHFLSTTDAATGDVELAADHADGAPSDRSKDASLAAVNAIESWGKLYRNRVDDARKQYMQALYQSDSGTFISSRLEQSHSKRWMRNTVVAASMAIFLFGRSLVSIFLATHVVIRVFFATATDSYTRTERIMTLATYYMLMLMISIWIFYQKSEQCCVQYRSHLGCSTNMGDSCLGETACSAIRVLHDERENPRLPDCAAFPVQGHALDFAILVGIVVSIAVIARIFLTLSFQLGGVVGTPQHFTPMAMKEVMNVAAWQAMILQVWDALTMFALYPSEMAAAAGRSFVLYAATVTRYIYRFVVNLVVWLFPALRAMAGERKFKLMEKRLSARSVHPIPDAKAQEMHLLRPRLAAAAAHKSRRLETIESNESFLEWENESLNRIRRRTRFANVADLQGYVLVVLLWAMGAWVIFAYANLAYDNLGRGTEESFLQSWGASALFDLWGLEALKVLASRTVYVLLFRLLVSITTGSGVSYIKFLEDALEVQAEGAGGRRTRNTIQVEKKDGGEHDFAGE